MKSDYLDDVKVWIFYIKSKPDVVYAYTTVKEYKDKFLEIRNPDYFHIEKVIMDELEFSMFMNKFRTTKLEKVPLGCGIKRGEYVEVIMTMEEENACNTLGYQLDHKMEDLYRSLVLHSGIKSKYTKVVEYLVNTGYELELTPGNFQTTSRFNMLFAFTTLFKDTLRGGS